MVQIVGRIGDSAAAEASGRIEFAQMQRINDGEMLVTSTTATAQVRAGRLETLQGTPFELPANPEGTAVRVREVLGGRTFEWWTSVPDADAVEYRDLPIVESPNVPASVFGPPLWVANVQQMRDETVEAIAEGAAVADALGGLAGVTAAVTEANTARAAASASSATATNEANRAQQAADSIDMTALNTRIDGMLAKDETVSSVYSVDGSGTQVMIPRTPVPTSQTLVQRDDFGRAEIAAPTLPEQIANKSYTDAAATAAAQSRTAKRARIVVGWGQSNMSGRGRIAENDTLYMPVPDRLKQFGYKTRTLRAASPILDHQDEPSGIGPLYDFGLRMLGGSGDDDVIVLVPAAQGGTPLVTTTAPSWNATISGSLFQNARTHLQQAITAVTSAYPQHQVQVEVLLWHQGEGDNTWPQYIDAFRELVAGFRAIAGGRVPVVIGQLQPKNITGSRYLVNQAHVMLARQDEFVAFADMPRTAANDSGDGTHYNATGQRALAASMWSAYQRARVNLQPRPKFQTPAMGEFGRDQFVVAGPLTKDQRGNIWEFQGSSSNVGRFITDGTFARLDPANPGAGRVFLLQDATYNRRVTVTTQWGSASVKSYRIILVFANPEDYLFIDVTGANFRLGRYSAGSTTYLGTSAIASSTAETTISVGDNTINGAQGSTAFGGNFPIAIPSDFEGGTMFGVSMQSSDAATGSLLSRITLALMDARPA
ncbi:sialate O-acetylesterase [Leucobacter sp. NPDC077196]|uniref:sialate O-acetylesterase n=1 Tax=Leucobacter sp. NPDC077196 TaxID=3154959 RepID=UPI0034408BB0